MEKTTYDKHGNPVVVDADAADSQPGARDPSFPAKHPMPPLPRGGVPMASPLPPAPALGPFGHLQQGPTPSPSASYPGDKRREQSPEPHPLRRAGDPYEFTRKYPSRVITPEEQARFTAHEQRVAEAIQAANKGGAAEFAPRSKAEQDEIP